MYNLRLTYPYGWQAKPYRLESSATEKFSLVISSPDKNTVVGMRPKYAIPKLSNMSGEQVDDSYEVVSTLPLASLPSSLDVRLLDKTDTLEDGSIVSESFTPLESVVSSMRYRQLGITANAHKLLSQSQQEFLFQPDSSTSVDFLLMAVDQKLTVTEQAARSWFVQPAALQAHAVLLSARSEH